MQPAQMQPQMAQGGAQPPPVQQLLMLKESIKQALSTYAATFPGGEQEIRQMLGLLEQAQGKQQQTLEQMLGPQQTPPSPY